MNNPYTINKLFWFLIALTACNLPNNNITTTHTEKYFPDSLSINGDSTFSRFLLNAGEGSLLERQDSSEIYRITFISSATFITSTVIRFEKKISDNVFNISGVALPNWRNNYSLIEKKEFKMTMKALNGNNYWDSLQIKLRRCDFWNLPFGEPNCGQGILDGGYYLFEGKLNGKYKMAIRNNPFNSHCPKHKEIMDLLNAIDAITEFGGGKSYRLL